jgi:alpha-1,3-glucan synthase
MRATTAAAAVVAFAALAAAAPYSDALKAYNLNSNKAAQSPLDYSTDTLANYTASPPNWREIPFYTILPDKWADGDPSNNDYFGTLYEADWRETQLRFGGDIKGMANRLDYLQGMGVKGIFMSGTPFLNQFWQADSMLFSLAFVCIIDPIYLGYSPLDLTVLDPHYGSIADWQQFIQAVHARGMYFMADFTVGTMGDLVAFKGCVWLLRTSVRRY